jgi:hypothetical protein
MSTSPADLDAPAFGPAALDDGAGQTVRPSGRGKNEITVVQVPVCVPVPGFLSADAPAATSTLEADIKKLKAALDTAARNAPVKRFGRRNKLPPGVVRGSAASGLLPAMLRRPSIAVAGMALATVMAAGVFAFVILPQTDDWELAELPPAASREPSAPAATALPYGSEAGATASEAARQSPPLPQPAAPLPPASPPESPPVTTPMEVAALLMTDDSHATPALPAIPEPSAMTARAPEPEPAPPASPEPHAPAAPAPPALAAPASPDAPMVAAREPEPPVMPDPQAEWPAANRTPPGVGMAAAPHGPSFPFADSTARYLSGAEQQKLSADRLRTARNEIFVRKGFKDDAIRVSSGAAEAGTPVAVTDPHRQYLTAAQLRHLSPDQLVLVRYEILARRGRYFKDPALRAYFEQFAWYRPYAWEVPLTLVERANVDLIGAYQQTMLAPGPAAKPWRTPTM